MIEENFPEINVDELIKKIREHVSKEQSQSIDTRINHVETSQLMISINYIENFLKNAELKAYIRTKWPDKLNRFPFNISPKIQHFILKSINFLFKDQREVNSNLISSLKESVALNKQLIEQITILKSHIYEHSKQLDEHHKQLDEHYQKLDERHKQLDEHYTKNNSYLKNDLMQQKRLITMFLQEAKKRLPEPLNQEQIQTFVNEEQNLLDAFYVAFEDQFRGNREDILDRLKVYLPLIQEAKIGTPLTPILDVGCGRGEWLELLQKSGYTARGIDINRVMLEQCQSRDLEVIEADVITYLQSLPDASLGAVTGFHIIEHLPFTMLIKLFDESVRVLKPGGLVIFETPNPDNLLVGSNTFYIDPTHRNPLPNLMISFLAESRGLSQVTIMKLHPHPASAMITHSGSDLAERFNEYFYGAQDYAVIGYKP
jgi:ubiquinone/menaquinone biosynthesis C-methylase UbiE